MTLGQPLPLSPRKEAMSNHFQICPSSWLDTDSKSPLQKRGRGTIGIKAGMYELHCNKQCIFFWQIILIFFQVVNLNLVLNALLSILQVHFIDKKQHWLFFKAESRAPLLPQETSGPASQQHWTDVLKFLCSFPLLKGSRKWKIRQLPACGGLHTHSIYLWCWTCGTWSHINGHASMRAPARCFSGLLGTPGVGKQAVFCL